MFFIWKVGMQDYLGESGWIGKEGKKNTSAYILVSVLLCTVCYLIFLVIGHFKCICIPAAFCITWEKEINENWRWPDNLIQVWRDLYT